MSLIPGADVELTIEKPAAGGRMIARHERQVVLVEGAIPGERVLARIQRVEPQLAFAGTLEVLDASPDRAAAGIDPRCGGCLYAHVAYPRQLALKGEVIQDAFVRLGRLSLEAPVAVAPSPTKGYRLRARLHVRGAEVGFYREGTHELCDAAPTGQLSDAALHATRAAVESLARSGQAVSSVELTENLTGTERALHITANGTALTDNMLDQALQAGALTGITGTSAEGTRRTAGVPVVTDTLDALTGGRAQGGILERHVESFFQANRFLLPELVGAVIDAISPGGDVLDLYAGVGLFAVAAAACGRGPVTAVEGDRTSGRDLLRNAATNGSAVHVVVGSVEEYFPRRKRAPIATLVVDPPRTGISRHAMPAIAASGAARIVYVSCDPPTMARDARRLSEAGYRLVSLRGFDLFPNTPHVEALGVFEKS
jgi:23S rRNA (uracil1939-C5)-methyltransferase